jgi:hypothetical protein
LRKVLIAVVVVLLVAAIGVGGYLQIYRPSQRDILTGSAPPMRAQMRAMGMLPVTPLSQLPKPDQERFAAALLDAVHTIEPDYRIVEDRMYVKYHGYGWAAVRKLSGEYLRSEFGFREQADAKAQVDGETVDYLVWRGGWLRRQFDDRLVVAVALHSLLRPDTATMVFGYFVMRPAS